MSTSDVILVKINLNLFYILAVTTFIAVFIYNNFDGDTTNSYVLYCPNKIKDGSCDKASFIPTYIMQFKANYARNEISVLSIPTILSYEVKESLDWSILLNERDLSLLTQCRILNIENWECGSGLSGDFRMYDNEYSSKYGEDKYLYVSWLGSIRYFV